MRVATARRKYPRAELDKPGRAVSVDREYPDVSAAPRLDNLQKTRLEQEQTMYIGLGVIVLILAVVLILSLMRRSSI